jgi:hypothetical protein
MTLESAQVMANGWRNRHTLQLMVWQCYCLDAPLKRTRAGYEDHHRQGITSCAFWNPEASNVGWKLLLELFLLLVSGANAEA